jgi:TolB-like protein/DNA-binding winged helix-turn-helix (wHTH) protein/Tfp pilus assembly protein PilF
MGSTVPPRRLFRFATFEVDLDQRRLRKNGQKVRIQDQPFHVLALLLERPGELFTRDELREKLWPADTFVDFDHSLHTAITKLREALGDEKDNPRFVETVPRHGYRFIAPLHSENQEPIQQTRGYRRAALIAIAPTVMLVALIVVLLPGKFRERLFHRAIPPLQVRSIVVLPFANMSSDPEQDYFADGMTEALTTDLAKIKSLRVISRTSAMHFKGTKQPLPEIARQLGADAVIEGAVVRKDEKIRVTTQLIDGTTDHHIWAETYERNQADILALQSDISRAIARQVNVALSSTGVEQRKPVAPLAYDAYLRNRFYISQANLEHNLQSAESEKDYELALNYARKAIELDPSSPLGYVGMARSYGRRCSVRGFILATGSLAKSKGAAAKAIELDDSLPEAHLAMGDVKMAVEWDWAGADKEFHRALELNPQSVETLLDYSFLLTITGRFDEAIELSKRATELDPLSVKAASNLGFDYFQAHRFDDSIRTANTILELRPESIYPRMMLSWNFAMKEMANEADAACKESLRRTSDSPSVMMLCAWAYGQAGRKQEAMALFDRARKALLPDDIDPNLAAFYYAGIGDKSQAIRFLQKAFKMHSSGLSILGVAPGLDGLRSDPRFQDLVRRMNFPH